MTMIERRHRELHMRCAAAYRNAALFLLLLFAAFSATAAEQRIALVIGNGKYPTAPLRNPVNDATAIAKELQQMGFEVIVKTNVGQRDMTRALSDFGEKITIGSVALFYYAGHGLQARGKNFLIPIDADIKSETSVSSEAVDVERVLDQLARARLSMVVLDACRNNPFERRFRSGQGTGLAQIDAPAGTLIAYATSPGRVALDGEGAHGTYTEALLRAIELPGLKVEDVFKQVRIQVLKATDNQQIPWESLSLTGEFVFRPAKLEVGDPSRQTKAEYEAAVLKEQMALLSAEITKLREARPAPNAVPSRNEQDQKKSEQDAAAVREQFALLSAEISKLRENRPVASVNSPKNEQDRKKVDQEAAAARDQLALLNTEIGTLSSGTTAPRAPTADELTAWKTQIAKVNAARGKLSFLTAASTLLNVESDADASTVKAFESAVGGRPYSTALALGVDATGFLVWGGSHSQFNRLQAVETALDFCAGAGGIKCKAVIANGSFAEDAWLEVIKQLGSQPVDAVRTAFIGSLRQPVTQTMTGSPTGLNNYKTSFGYTYSRVASK